MSRLRIAGLLLAIVTLAIYLPVSHYGFSNFDDDDYVTDNFIVQSGLTWKGIKWAFTTWHAANWHPLTWISHMADCQLFGLNAGAQHCINVLFHTASSILLLLLFFRWTKEIWPSAFAAALFAWHPLRVESVAWVSERKDVLSTFFALLALLAYTKFVEQFKAKNPKPKVFYALALLMFAFALLSKPMFVTLPFVMLLLDFWLLKRVAATNFQPSFVLQLLREKSPFFALTIASCVVTFLAQHSGGAVVSLERVPLALRLENAPVVCVRYLLKMFWPSHLAVFYPLPEKIPAISVAVAIAILFFISAAVWLARKNLPCLIFGWLWFLGTLVPVIGLVQVGGAALADRYTYFPSIGIFLAVAMGVYDMAKRFHFSKTIPAAGAILILAVCLALTHRQLNFWRDDVSLFSRSLAVAPDNDTARFYLGLALENAGRKSEAMVEYRRALKLDPGRAQTHDNLANLLDNAGHPGEALAEYQEALRLQPDDSTAHNNLGTLLVELGRFDEAQDQYAEAARLAPNDWHAPYLTGKALLKQGRDAEATPFFQQALKLSPNNWRALNFFAQVLASDENANVRNGQAALTLATKANALSGGVQPAVLDTLGMAEAENGQFSQAQHTAKDAIRVARAFEMTNDAALIEQRLKFYQNNRPFRQSFTNAPELLKK